VSERFDPRARVITVRARLLGPAGSGAATLALDTGATTTLIDPRILQLIGADPAKATTFGFITAATSIAYVPKVAVPVIEAIQIRRRSLLVLATALPPSAGVDGLLGLDLFRGKRLSIDFRKGRIDLR
jgi:predicted aspartyl protease